MSLPSFKLLRPRTVEEAVALMLEHSQHVQILAGGTDLLPSLKQKLFTPDYVMDIRGIDEMQGIHVRRQLRMSAVHGERVLRKVVAADRKKIHFAHELIGE